jgi:4a-hydroxytetrahydrobiopterin dehydratase
MAELLSDSDVRTALESLPGWGGDTRSLTRTVPVEEDQVESLEHSIAAVGDSFDHHADLERSAEGLHVRLSTHSAGGVTAKDVELAARLDRVFSGSGPHGEDPLVD